ncbi:hypothetical protein SY83_05030 [Paenibacillus swuensis]|uniref:Low temperature-induced protein n=1 Tax=Paenibacillus swuensis TaxID=1178515 RepID=A0A172TFW4_9BACL|nr:general stress protein [Paenibacillus swuensis]ANE45767.1 hypothetical protein SY83_05030 [Paenibacillus swuensis]
MRNHVIGVFSTEQETVSAIEKLRGLGYKADEISVVGRHANVKDEEGSKAPEGVAAGVSTGSIIGGITGLLVGLGVLIIPGIGPILAAGPIATTLAGIAVGAGTGGLVGTLIGLGIPEKDAELYNTYLQDEKLIVIIEAFDEHRDRIYDIFRQAGSLNQDTYIYSNPRNNDRMNVTINARH